MQADGFKKKGKALISKYLSSLKVQVKSNIKKAVSAVIIIFMPKIRAEFVGKYAQIPSEPAL